ncbi:hypothetical protein E4U57_006978 [Claviceps arundinis]|uniref:Secreted protein n=1 Tax=Claviceps arundinis TaxID=1623583 RepID=A0A9P7SNQ4_9HYPO|nr:hypothetical protein E4U57_006978 [Claviceps arundinis]KAG5966732.1 hypothetical protein E4U56_001197 [Claviceps arundinis]
MLKNTSVFIAALAVFGTVVQGQPQRTCKEGLDYCGAALKNMGYRLPPGLHVNNNQLWRCVAGNEMHPRAGCLKGCIGAGIGKSDYCRK